VQVTGDVRHDVDQLDGTAAAARLERAHSADGGHRAEPCDHDVRTVSRDTAAAALDRRLRRRPARCSLFGDRVGLAFEHDRELRMAPRIRRREGVHIG
jgi:hypothetical protein